MRHKLHNYNTPGAYFVTSVTFNRDPIFGSIVGDKLCLSNFGEILKACWTDLPHFFPAVKLDAFQVMPDHIHGLLILTAETEAGTLRLPDYGLSKVMWALKANSARKINLERESPGVKVWQDGFMDRVVRSEAELQKYRDYILNNPLSAVLEGSR